MVGDGTVVVVVVGEMVVLAVGATVEVVLVAFVVVVELAATIELPNVFSC